MKTRVRFAPSPTGPLHIGGLRTALFNYLFARKNNGVFILRVEDTDQNRYVEGSEAYIQKSLEWAGMVPDEGPFNGGEFGPYRQSERKEIYREYIDLLIQKGGAYYAFDKTEDLSNERAAADSEGRTFLYGAQNRMLFDNSLNLSPEETAEKIKGDYVVRLKVEPGQNVTVFDEIRGTIHLDSSLLDDKILMKSDGMPTYHFANVVDDHLMQISCVIRGEEWLPSLPIHQLIYNAFGWKEPKFMHLPLILKPSGKGKLSKRDGDKDGFPVFPMQLDENSSGFKEKGFIASAFINYLALLGWNSGTEQEIFTMAELEKLFNFEGIQKGGARFDYEKAKWVNHQHLQLLEAKTLVQEPAVQEQLIGIDPNKHIDLIKLLKERLFTINDLKEEVHWVKAPFPMDEKIASKLSSKNPQNLLKEISNNIETMEELSDLKERLMTWSKENEIPVGILMQSLRMALVGKLTGPDLFEICKVLGKDVTLKRIDQAISYFNLKSKSL